MAALAKQRKKGWTGHVAQFAVLQHHAAPGYSLASGSHDCKYFIIICEEKYLFARKFGLQYEFV